MNQSLSAKQTIDLYNDNFWSHLFAKIRFSDAPYLEVEKLLPKKGIIVELGCGEGIFTNFLGVSAPKRTLIGIEIDDHRIARANRKVPNVKFLKSDATKVEIPKCNTIVMFHLLHHLNSSEQQEKLIERCYRSLSVGERLVIVEVDPKLTPKFWITWFTDRYLVPWVFGKRFSSPIFFRKKSEWLTLLKKVGFKCGAQSAEEGKPFTHIVYNCTKV